MNTRRRRKSVGTHHPVEAQPDEVAVAVPVGEPIQVPAQVPEAKVYDTLCYCCMEDSKRESMTKCPTCTMVVHRSCLYTSDIVRQYGSIEHAFKAHSPSITNRLRCPNGHAYFQSGFLSSFAIIKAYSLRLPLLYEVAKAILTLVLLLALLGVSHKLPSQYFLPVAFGLFLIALGGIVVATPGGSRTVYDTDPRMFTWLSPTLYFAIHGAMELINNHIPWIKVLLPLSILMSSVDTGIALVLCALTTPIVWTWDTKMMDWLTPWLAEYIGVYLTGITLGLVALSYIFPFDMEYKVQPK